VLKAYYNSKRYITGTKNSNSITCKNWLVSEWEQIRSVQLTFVLAVLPLCVAVAPFYGREILCLMDRHDDFSVNKHLSYFFCFYNWHTFLESVQFRFQHITALPSFYSCASACIFDLRNHLQKPLLPSNRHRLSGGDCLEDKREDYQNCSVLYCVPQF